MRKVIGGIYCITCLASNKSYIGSSYDIYGRWSEHITDLNRNRHHSQKLQNSWNKYGEKSFAFSILEEVLDRNVLGIIEQKWLDKLDTYHKGLNCSPHAHEEDRWMAFKEASCKSCIITFPDGHEEKIKGLQEFCRRHGLNQGAMNRISLYQLNHYKHFHCRLSTETMKEWQQKRALKISQRPPKQMPSPKRQGGKWKIIKPDKSEIITNSLTEFCKQNKLSQGNMTEVAFGNRKQHKGFKCEYLGVNYPSG